MCRPRTVSGMLALVASPDRGSRMDVFVWTKMGAESGEGLEQIVRRKEAERLQGSGQFWWGIGNSLGPAVRGARSLSQGGREPSPAKWRAC